MENVKKDVAENLSPEDLKELGDVAQEGMAVAKETLQKVGESLGDNLTRFLDRANEFLRGNPNRAVAAGIVIGLFTGLLLRPKRAF